MENLKEELDERLVARSKEGDKLAEEELLTRHLGMVRSCARQYFLFCGETEDLIQVGMLGLLSAIRNFDGEKSKDKSFKGFAYLCVRRRILDAVKPVYNKKNGEIYCQQSLEYDMVERGLSPEELLILSDEEKEFRQKMGKVLSDFEFRVTTMYMDGMTTAEICESTGKEYKSVDNALQRSKKKLLGILKR